MFREVAKQTLGVIVGGVIGGLIAFLIGESFWWIGVLSGGFIGYLAGEPRELLQGLRTAFAHLKPVDRPWYRLMIGFLTSISFGIVVCGGFALLCLSPRAVHFWINVSIVVMGSIIGLLSILPALYMENIEKDYVPLNGIFKKRKWINTIIVGPFVVVSLVGLFIYSFWKYFFVPFFKASGRFFRYIHSRKRAIRLVDAMIVAFIAWRFGGNIPEIATIGIVGGLVVAPIHYYLVSIKLLGLVPNGGTSH